MESIFKNAHFGKIYRTKDGRKAIYITCDDKDFNSHPHQLIQEDTKKFHYHNDYGQVMVKYDSLESEMYDIVSEWYEEINVEAFNELAKKVRLIK